MPRRVEARAPTRVDLAGGTVDLWPLHLLLNRPLTVNAAIDVEATATIETSETPGWEIVSRDRGVSCRIPPDASLGQAIAAAPEAVTFIVRLAHHFLDGVGRAARTRALRITTACRAPAGSGLGGSSTLGIALATALDRYTGRHHDPAERLTLTRMIETQVLRIPTGEQDYHPARHGGTLALHYSVEGTRVERLSVDGAALGRRTVLVFTGMSRASGISNWDMLKRHLDGDPDVREALDRIIEATHAMRRALLAADWNAAGEALGREWEARKRMSPTVTNGPIDRLIEAARSAGAIAGKVCGAGGGGCVVLWARDGMRDKVAQSALEQGATVLDCHFVSEGVSLTES